MHRELPRWASVRKTKDIEKHQTEGKAPTDQRNVTTRTSRSESTDIPRVIRGRKETQDNPQAEKPTIGVNRLLLYVAGVDRQSYSSTKIQTINEIASKLNENASSGVWAIYGQTSAKDALRRAHTLDEQRDSGMYLLVVKTDHLPLEHNKKITIGTEPSQIIALASAVDISASRHEKNTTFVTTSGFDAHGIATPTLEKALTGEYIIIRPRILQQKEQSARSRADAIRYLMKRERSRAITSSKGDEIDTPPD